jgi:hypothetical protein
VQLEQFVAPGSVEERGASFAELEQVAVPESVATESERAAVLGESTSA